MAPDPYIPLTPEEIAAVERPDRVKADRPAPKRAAWKGVLVLWLLSNLVALGLGVALFQGPATFRAVYSSKLMGGCIPFGESDPVRPGERVRAAAAKGEVVLFLKEQYGPLVENIDYAVVDLPPRHVLRDAGYEALTILTYDVCFEPIPPSATVPATSPGG